MNKKVYVNAEAKNVITVIYKDDRVIGRGKAVCREGDVFDEEIGKNLSSVSAWKKAQQKLAKDTAEDIEEIKFVIKELDDLRIVKEALYERTAAKAKELEEEQEKLLATL